MTIRSSIFATAGPRRMVMGQRDWTAGARPATSQVPARKTSRVVRVVLRRLIPLFVAFALGTVLAVGPALLPAAAQQDEVSSILKQFDTFYNAEDYSAALVEAQKLEAAVRARDGTSGLTYAAVLGRLATVEQMLKQYDVAEQSYKKALAIIESARGATGSVLAITLTNLGSLYVTQKRYADAETVLDRALQINKQNPDPQNAEAANTLNILGVVYHKQGRLAEAELLFQRALSIRQRVLGAKHADVAESLHNLASIYLDQNRDDEAHDYYIRALTIDEPTISSRSAEFMWNLWSMRTRIANLNERAQVLQSHSQSIEAEGLYKKAIAILEKSKFMFIGDTRRDIIEPIFDAYEGLAGIYQTEGNYRDQERILKQLLDIKELGGLADILDVADTRNKLAVVYRDQGNYADAERLYKSALSTREQRLGSQNPAVVAIWNNLGVV